MHFLEVLLQICLTLWSGITVTEEISSRGLITGNARVGGSCHRNRLRYDSSFHIDDYYHDTASVQMTLSRVIVRWSWMRAGTSALQL